MNTKGLVLVLGLAASSSVWSFNCYFTLVKDNCWLKYNVNVRVIDASTEKEVLSVSVPAGQAWARETFACSPKQSLTYLASFTPVIWESEKGKVYNSVTNWILPDTIKPGDKAWTISVCYPKSFVQVPMPPEATSSCACDFSAVPPIPAQ